MTWDPSLLRSSPRISTVSQDDPTTWNNPRTYLETMLADLHAGRKMRVASSWGGMINLTDPSKPVLTRLELAIQAGVASDIDLDDTDAVAERCITVALAVCDTVSEPSDTMSGFTTPCRALADTLVLLMRGRGTAPDRLRLKVRCASPFGPAQVQAQSHVVPLPISLEKHFGIEPAWCMSMRIQTIMIARISGVGAEASRTPDVSMSDLLRHAALPDMDELLASLAARPAR